jgi:hypothetical protein
MAEFDMEKDLMIDANEGEDFGLGEFASETPEENLGGIEEFAPTEVEEIDDVDTEKIASCFPDWSLTPEEMFKMDSESSKSSKKGKK